MKTFDELKKTPRLLITQAAEDGGTAQAYLLSSKKKTPAMVVFSNGGGWDHVSVSFRNRCPSWEEMSEIKRMFFYPEEICVEYHPAESQYVNNFPYCLHIWRYQQPGMPYPPYWMVGAKDGQSIAEAMREAMQDLEKSEAAPATDPEKQVFESFADARRDLAEMQEKERMMEYGT